MKTISAFLMVIACLSCARLQAEESALLLKATVSMDDAENQAKRNAEDSRHDAKMKALDAVDRAEDADHQTKLELIEKSEDLKGRGKQVAIENENDQHERRRKDVERQRSLEEKIHAERSGDIDLPGRMMKLAEEMDRVASEAQSHATEAGNKFFGALSTSVAKSARFLAQKPGTVLPQMADGIVTYLTNDHDENDRKLYEAAAKAVDDMQNDPATFFGEHAIDIALAGTGAAGELAEARAAATAGEMSAARELGAAAEMGAAEEAGTAAKAGGAAADEAEKAAEEAARRAAEKKMADQARKEQQARAEKRAGQDQADAKRASEKKAADQMRKEQQARAEKRAASDKADAQRQQRLDQEKARAQQKARQDQEVRQRERRAQEMRRQQNKKRDNAAQDREQFRRQEQQRRDQAKKLEEAGRILQGVADDMREFSGFNMPGKNGDAIMKALKREHGAGNAKNPFHGGARGLKGHQEGIPSKSSIPEAADALKRAGAGSEGLLFVDSGAGTTGQVFKVRNNGGRIEVPSLPEGRRIFFYRTG